jgi:hypothetical protein
MDCSGWLYAWLQGSLQSTPSKHLQLKCNATLHQPPLLVFNRVVASLSTGGRSFHNIRSQYCKGQQVQGLSRAGLTCWHCQASMGCSGLL